MTELISNFLSLVLILVGWFFGNKEERKRRAKEIADKFQKVTVKGDNLYKQVWNEMSQRSDTDWEDIEIRDTKKENP